MAFKSVSAYNEDRYHGKFRLPNHEDDAEVIFLYRDRADELIANAHYIRSNKYSGYVHCCGQGCPACAKGMSVQSKLFVPVYVLKQNGVPQEKILFWDRQVKFDIQLERDVFSKVASPVEYVFKIVRNGVSEDRNTRYSIQAINKNNFMSYDTILAKFNAKMPDYYSEVIRDYSIPELAQLLQNVDSTSSDLPEYTPIPRAGYQSSVPNTYVNAATAIDSSVEVSSSEDEFLDDDIDGEVGPEPSF